MELYRELLDPDRVTPVAEQAGGHGVYHLAVVRDADVRGCAGTEDHGISTGIHYPVPAT